MRFAESFISGLVNPGYSQGLFTAGESMGAFSQGNTPEALKIREEERAMEAARQTELAKQQHAMAGNQAMSAVFQAGVAGQPADQAIAAAVQANPGIDVKRAMEVYEGGAKQRETATVNPLGPYLAGELRSRGLTTLADALEQPGALEKIPAESLAVIMKKAGVADETAEKAVSPQGRLAMDMFNIKPGQPNFDERVSAGVKLIFEMENREGTAAIITAADKYIRGRVNVDKNEKIDNTVAAMRGFSLDGADAIINATLFELFSGSSRQATKANMDRIDASASVKTRIDNFISKAINGQVSESTATDRAHLVYLALKTHQDGVERAVKDAAKLTQLGDENSDTIMSLYSISPQAKQWMEDYESVYIKKDDDPYAGMTLTPEERAALEQYSSKQAK